MGYRTLTLSPVSCSQVIRAEVIIFREHFFFLFEVIDLRRLPHNPKRSIFGSYKQSPIIRGIQVFYFFHLTKSPRLKEKNLYYFVPDNTVSDYLLKRKDLQKLPFCHFDRREKSYKPLKNNKIITSLPLRYCVSLWITFTMTRSVSFQRSRSFLVTIQADN